MREEPICESCGHVIADSDIMLWYGWGRVNQEGSVAKWMYFHPKCWGRWKIKHLSDIPPPGVNGSTSGSRA